MVTLYAAARILAAEGRVSLGRLEALLLSALPGLRGVSVNSSREELEAEYAVAAARLGSLGCRVDGDEIVATPTCLGALAAELGRVERLAGLLAGTPLPFYLREAGALLPEPRLATGYTAPPRGGDPGASGNALRPPGRRGDVSRRR